MYIYNSKDDWMPVVIHKIWVWYINPLTWIKAMWEWFPLLTMVPVITVIIYPDKINDRCKSTGWASAGRASPKDLIILSDGSFSNGTGWILP